MKKLLLFAFLATIAISGCKKDVDSVPIYNYPGEVTINNVTTYFTDMGFYKYGSLYQIENYGVYDQGKLQVYFYASSTGDINFTEDIYLRVRIGSNKVYLAKSDGGKITITQLNDKSVVGTFSGKFTDENGAEVNITGSFSSTTYTTFVDPNDI